ncbi:MAG: PKD domain-containing protein [Planctomycetes bacterium]|nr:PKD domain-containing protein [Planctomycetota bacterium]
MRLALRLLSAIVFTCTAVAAQCDVTTLFAANNGGSVGGAVYFDLTATQALSITGVDVNALETAGSGIGLTLYTIPGGTAGHLGNSAGWTQVAIDDGTGTARGLDAPSPITFQTPAIITPGSYGVALVASGTGGAFSHAYTSSGSSSTTFSNAFLSITLGNADNTPFSGGAFAPRVWNGTIHCGGAAGIFANFEATPANGPSPLSVQFVDTSYTSDPNGIVSSVWDFGDGTTPVNAQNPSHTYQGCGEYDVTLTVTDLVNGSHTLVKREFVVVDPNRIPVAEFRSSVITGAPPLTVTFTDLSRNAPTTWAWDFDNDGTIDSTAQNPSTTYVQAGLYDVSLTVANACGDDTEVKTAFIAVVVNDDCGGALPVVDGLNGPYSNVGATTDPSYTWPCILAGDDLYFTYTPSCDGNVTADTCGSGLDTAIEIFDGTQGCGSLVSLACNDNACGLQSRATATGVTMGTPLIIRVGSVAGARGSFHLNITCQGPQGNDECTRAVALTEGVNGPFDNATATTSAPGWPCALGAYDVWFSYTPTCPGTYAFDTCTGSTYDTAIELFDGAAGCSGLVSIACNDDTCRVQSSVTAPLAAGTTYYVRVGGFAGAQGTFNLEVRRSGGTGSFRSVFPGCGGLLINTTGSPLIGGTITYALSSVQGTGFVWLGIQPLGTPICTGCLLGTEFTVLVSASSVRGTLPCDISLAGRSYYTQGVDVGSAAPGGCPAGIPFPFSMTLSDTIQTTVGM